MHILSIVIVQMHFSAQYAAKKSPREDIKHMYASWTLPWNVNGRLKAKRVWNMMTRVDATLLSGKPSSPAKKSLSDSHTIFVMWLLEHSPLPNRDCPMKTGKRVCDQQVAFHSKLFYEMWIILCKLETTQQLPSCTQNCGPWYKSLFCLFYGSKCSVRWGHDL